MRYTALRGGGRWKVGRGGVERDVDDVNVNWLSLMRLEIGCTNTVGNTARSGDHLRHNKAKAFYGPAILETVVTIIADTSRKSTSQTQ